MDNPFLEHDVNIAIALRLIGLTLEELFGSMLRKRLRVIDITQHRIHTRMARLRY